MSRPLFQLGPRLALCAELLQGGRPLCDVGTDHAYLPIWLLKRGKVPRAVACDVNAGPLEAAVENARRYRVGEGQLILRQSDGLREIAPEEAEEIVIAGMGGELILRIVAETLWLRDRGKGLVLQPMSSAAELRSGLRELGFALLEERAVEDGGRVYTAFSVRYGGELPHPDPLYPLMGKLEPGTQAVRRYAQKVLRELAGRLEGAARGRGADDPEELRAAMEAIRKKYLEE